MQAPQVKNQGAFLRAAIEEGLATNADFEKFADYDDPGEFQHFFRIEKAPSPASRR